MRELTNEEKRNINELYRKVFSSHEGQMVLTDILNDCGYLSLQDMEDPSEIARLNVGRRILGKCGVWEDCYAEEIVKRTVGARNLRELVRSLLSLPIPKRKERA